jgi:DNA processing protein
MSLAPAERLAWLRLARTESVGPVTFAQLIGRYRSASAALEAIPDLARRAGAAAAGSPARRGRGGTGGRRPARRATFPAATG